MAPRTRCDGGSSAMKAFVRIQGGLGNQLFQVAMAARLEELGYSVSLLHLQNPNDTQREFQPEVEDGWRVATCNALLRWPVIRVFSIARRLPRIPFVLHSKELPRSVAAARLPVVADGYFQSSANALSYIRSTRGEWLRQKVLQSSQEGTLAMHIRLGDYRTNPEVAIALGTLDANYFLRARMEVQKHAVIRNVVIFSDEPEFAEKMLGDLGMPTSYKVASSSPIDDLVSIASHQYLVLSNSTYSAWAAYLAESVHDHVVVIAPSAWIRQRPNAIDMVRTDRWKVID